MSDQPNPIVHRVAINLCEPCLNGEGKECHTPECAAFLHAVDLPFYKESYEILDRRDAATQPGQTDLREAFREGYKSGYSNGGSDQCSFEWGAGSKHAKTLKRDEDEAWQESDAAALSRSEPTPDSVRLDGEALAARFDGLADEWLKNGGIDWSEMYRKMAADIRAALDAARQAQ